MLETHFHVSALGMYATHLSTEKCWPSTGDPCVSTLHHPETHSHTKNKHVIASVYGQLWVSTWFRMKSNIYVPIVTETALESSLPFTIWYPHLPAALHITTTDPQPVSKRLHSPLLSNPTSLFHLGPMRTPRRRTAATISAHVNMQHLHTHHRESPLKITQLL